MSRRVVTVVAGVLALVLVVGGAVAALSALASSRGDDRGSSPAAPSQAPSREPVGDQPDPGASKSPSPGLDTYYSQTLDWSACGQGNECATLSVPLDYEQPTGETIDLALLKVPAAEPDQRVGSLVVNPGGPGAPGTSYAASAAQVFRDRLTDNFDIVGFDPRGTGESDPVDCLSDTQLDAYVAGDPDPETPAETQAYAEATQRIGAGCVQLSGDLASHVSTVEAARDMDVLRAALGRDRLDYFGASYGTKLGATYAELFPTKVGRFVLDGAVDPTLTNRDLNLQQATGFETALRAYVQNCVDETSSCFLGEDVDTGIAAIKTFTDQVDENPLPTDLDRDLTVGNAFYGIVAPLYNRDYWVVLSQALRSGMGGDGTLLLQLSDLYTSRGADGYTDNSTEANYAINCLDDSSSITAGEVPAQVAEFEAASPTFGAVFAWSLTNCSGVQTKAAALAPTITGAGAAPIVVVGTSRDPATPYQWAVNLAGQLESGVLVSRDGDGHTAYNSGNECIDDTLESYLVDDAVPEDGLEC
ncbi:MAG: alpha/beta hydrolase [Nocardioides sp.]|nr:alpha/beta hydrolase [Nocardioides sp.]